MLKFIAPSLRATTGVVAALFATFSFAISAVNPTGVNVRSNAPNTVFITFQGLEPNERAIEALWCGTVQPLASVPVRSAAATLCSRHVVRPPAAQLRPLARHAGHRPAQLQRHHGDPGSVVRRAVQEGIEGKNSDFFYVRHFTGGSTGDKWVVVTCRLGAGGTRTPLSLIDVKMVFGAG